MSRLWLVAVVFVFAFAAAQLVRPAHSNPPIDVLHPEARLSAHEVETICGAARLAAAQVSR